MAGIAKGHRALKDQMNTYLRGCETDKDGDMVSSDPTGTWYRAAMALTKEIMDKVGLIQRLQPMRQRAPSAY
jgi:hypothetical protein